MRFSGFVILVIAMNMIACQDDHSDLLSLQLINTKGEEFNFSELQKVKASCFFFLSPECPLSQNYSLTINQLRAAYNSDSILFYGVFPGQFYSKNEIKEFIEKYKMSQYKMLMDSGYELTHLLGATITPEVFILDKNGNTLYSGAIDNWAFALGKKRNKATELYLQDALNAIVTDKSVPQEKTKAIGCIIQ